jgi:hypothetical protein
MRGIVDHDVEATKLCLYDLGRLFPGRARADIANYNEDFASELLDRGDRFFERGGCEAEQCEIRAFSRERSRDGAAVAWPDASNDGAFSRQSPHVFLCPAPALVCSLPSSSPSVIRAVGRIETLSSHQSSPLVAKRGSTSKAIRRKVRSAAS